jgi:hypothetical protein
MPGRDQTRPYHDAVVDRAHQRHVGETDSGAEIAHGCEPGEQRRLRGFHSTQREIAGREADRFRFPAVDKFVIQVDVRVHQARQQRLAVEPDRFRVCRARRRIDCGDPVAIDEDDRGRDHPALYDVEVARGLDDDGFRHCGRDGEHGARCGQRQGFQHSIHGAGL